jgi:hypothetical protein
MAKQRFLNDDVYDLPEIEIHYDAFFYKHATRVVYCNPIVILYRSQVIIKKDHSIEWSFH